MSRIAIVAALVLLSGCVNNYEKFYQGTPTRLGSPSHFQGEPRVFTASSEPEKDILRLYEDGYAQIGASSFIGPAVTPEGAVAQAKKVGAAVVILTRKYQSTASGSMPITMPTTQTSYSSGTVNAYGPRGAAFGNYGGTTTTYGSQTTYIPYSVDRYEQGALYFVPLQRRGIGLMASRMTDDQRRQVETNQGVQVLAVRKGSPAFRADILPGDVILAIDGEGVADVESGQRRLVMLRDREIEFSIARGTQRLSKKLFNSFSEW